MKLALLTIGVALACGATSGFAQENWQNYLDEVRIKKAIADTLSPAQLEARQERLAKLLATRAANSVNAPGDTCDAATFEISGLPFNSAGTTFARADSINLGSSCAAPTACTGGGGGTGTLYTGSGNGPDEAFRIMTSADCTLTIDMDPNAEDLGLYVYQAQCSNSGADCACMDDTGVAGTAEQVTLSAIGGTTYFVVADGYSTALPGPADDYTLAISGAGCSLLPVELQSFEIN